MLPRILFVIALAVIAALPPRAAQAQQTAPAWRYTPIELLEDSPICFDPARPDVIVVHEKGASVAYNWRSGERTPLNPRPFTLCGPDGTFFAADGPGGWRFRLDDPAGQAIQHRPTHVAEGGGSLIYALSAGEIWFSPDGGTTWQGSPNPYGAGLTQLLPATGSNVYALVTEEGAPAPVGAPRREIRYRIFFSPDGGASWGMRAGGTTGSCVSVGVKLWRPAGPPADVGLVGLDRSCNDKAGSGAFRTVELSRDGGRTFGELGNPGAFSEFLVANTAAGLLLYQTPGAIARSADNGITWENLGSVPGILDPSGGSRPLQLEVAPAAPSYVFLSDDNFDLWLSTDSGTSWRKAANRAPASFQVAPHGPPVLLGIEGGALRVFEAPGLPVAGERCFPETGYCISGRIREFWEQNGGLPVFGYPIGPQSRAVVEGRPIESQWFERNRLELHPENQAPYDVLLGRLGADRLERRGRSWQSYPAEAPQPGCRFFPETGRNVCGEILGAWRASGLEFDGRRGVSEAESLALFGLPLTPPIQETLGDGRQYTVQYFERARFELHPENAPPYNVLLGLLGNELRGR